MTTSEAIQLVKNTFLHITNSKNINELQSILNNVEVLSKNKIKTEKYPKIEFSISSNEVEELKKIGIISSDLKFSFNSETFDNESLLTKLLYSIVWKNGDLGKENHILSGICGHEKKDEKGYVFYQFGKFLGDQNKEEPIIDQHTLRAYGAYLCLDNQISRILACIKEENKSIDFEYYRKLKLTTKNEVPLIEDYKKWIKQQYLFKQKDFVYNLDLVLFALGKAIKEN